MQVIQDHRPATCAKRYNYIALCMHCMPTMLIQYHRPAVCAKSQNYITLRAYNANQYHRTAMCAKSYNVIALYFHCMPITAHLEEQNTDREQCSCNSLHSLLAYNTKLYTQLRPLLSNFPCWSMFVYLVSQSVSMKRTSSRTISIPPSMKPKLFAGDTIASAEGAPSKMSPYDICKHQI